MTARIADIEKAVKKFCNQKKEIQHTTLYVRRSMLRNFFVLFKRVCPNIRQEYAFNLSFTQVNRHRLVLRLGTQRGTRQAQSRLALTERGRKEQAQTRAGRYGSRQQADLKGRHKAPTPKAELSALPGTSDIIIPSTQVKISEVDTTRYIHIRQDGSNGWVQRIFATPATEPTLHGHGGTRGDIGRGLETSGMEPIEFN
ncbi:hypothetical protein Btru_028103 [Bulinus truncatus]|nr:hypothetical protein Btru_028103 [Bulinus truncatus]